MKSKHLLLTLLLALFVPWAAMAQQTETFTVYADQTGTNSYIPIYGTWADANQQSEFIIPAADLADIACGTISELTFHLSSKANKVWNGTAQIYLKEVNETTFEAPLAYYGTEGATIVYEGGLDAYTSTEMVVPFTQDVTYTYGGGNLLVGLIWTTGGNYGGASFYGKSATGASISHYGSNSPSAKNFIPRVTFTYTPSPYAPPASISYTNNEPGNITVSWTAPNTTETVTGYKYRYKKTAVTDWDGWYTLGASTTSGTLAGLDYSTEYEFEVKAVYGENESCSAKKVTFTTLSDCMTPENLTITDVTDNSATFEWTEGFGAGQWVFGYKKTTDEEYTTMAVAAADLPLTLDVFEGNTRYDVKVYPVCDETKILTDNFKTQCGVTTVTASDPYSEDFTDYTTGVSTSTTAPSDYPNHTLPDCWDFVNMSETTGSYPQAFITSYSSYAASTGNYLFFKSSSTTPLYAILPLFDQPISNLVLSFAYRNEGTSTSNGTLYVGYMNGNDFVSVYTCPKTTAKTTVEEIEFTSAPAGSRIAFKYMGGTNNNYYMSIDDVVVDIAPLCSRPGTPVASNVTNHSATLTWTASEGQTAWQIAYKAGENFDPTDAEALATATVMDVEANPYTFVKTLDANTTYYMYVRGNCGTDGYSQWSKTVCSFTTMVAAPAPTNLTVTNVSAFTADVYWNAGGGDNETSWEIFYTDDATFDMANYTGGAIDVTTLPTAENPYPLEGLTEETSYRLWVRGNNGTDGNSAWAGPKSFTTDEACPMPTLNAATNITQTGANISWNASPDVESYTLQYREAAYVEGLDEGFDSWPTDWTRYTGELNNDGTATLTSSTSAFSLGTNCGVFDSHVYVNMWSTKNYWLVTPSLTIENGYVLSFDMAYTKYSSGSANNAPVLGCTTHRFAVLISTDNMATWSILREWNNSGSEYVLDEIAQDGSSSANIDLSAYAGEGIYIAFFVHSETSSYDNNFHFDNVGVGVSHAATEWMTASEEAETPYTLVPENVQPNKKYDVQVKPNCGEEYSASIPFTTKKENEFVFLGTEDDDWSNEANWSPEQLPTIDDDVIIRADVTIPALEDYDWAYEANKVTFEGGATLTIADGGRLASNNSVNGTIQKHINHYEDYYGRDNYYLLSLPVSAGYYGYNPSNAGMITDSEFDLYYFDEAQTGMEWRSYNPGDNGGAPFSLEQRKGYLYANSADVDLSFSGTFMRSDLPVVYNLSNTGTGEFAGLNLVGNPFICQAYLTYYDANDEAFLEVDYYVLDGDAIDVVPTMDYINPCSGAFVVADENMYDAEEEEYRVYFFSEINSGVGKKKAAALNITLDNNNRSGKHLDVARLRLGQGIGLKKFMLNPNGSKIYFPQANADYSVVYTENAGEMPLNFKAESNGTYRLSFSNENVEFNYLHLIDNMTGADVDLLATPSYSFEANSTDYASRFTIVFATGKTDDSFAYFSNGSFVISNEGNATLQVVDVMGRIISSETINGSANVSVNAAPGVYMLRLVNGDNVKVQKVVVK